MINSRYNQIWLVTFLKKMKRREHTVIEHELELDFHFLRVPELESFGGVDLRETQLEPGQFVAVEQEYYHIEGGFQIVLARPREQLDGVARRKDEIAEEVHLLLLLDVLQLAVRVRGEVARAVAEVDQVDLASSLLVYQQVVRLYIVVDITQAMQVSQPLQLQLLQSPKLTS